MIAAVSGLSTVAAAGATAATFTVNYSGNVTGQNEYFTAPFEFLFLEPEEIEELTRLRPPEQPTRIEGTYTFDDVTSEVISAQFQLIPPLQSDRDPSLFDLPSPADGRPQIFTPATPVTDPDEIIELRNNRALKTTFSTADATAARYGENLEGFTSVAGSSVSVDAQNFSYSSFFSELGTGNAAANVVGLIDRFALATDQESPEAPASVPEPSAAIALLITGIAFSLRDRS